MAVLSVRLLTIDHYMSKPLPCMQPNQDENCKSSSTFIPVLRIFGPTSTGEKSCVHVHGVFPYIYVPYEGGENADRDALLLAAGIDRAMQAADNNDHYKSSQRYVHRIRLVSGTPMYGYHARPRQFFKIYFFNPFSVRRVSDLLLKGAILNMKLQPHESHIPFTLQFMMDYNLFGMNLVNFSKVKYRQDPAATGELENIPAELILADNIIKTSHCHIEVDVLAEDILNRLNLSNTTVGIATNPGLAGIWAEEKARRRLKGCLSDPTPPCTQSRPASKPFGVEVDFLNDLESRLSQLCTDLGHLETSKDDLRTPYPAEVPESGALLDASVIVDNDVADDEPNIDAENLINETLVHELTQLARGVDDSEDSESGEEGGQTEGRVDGAGPEDEGAVLDMTQPLSPPARSAGLSVSEREGSSSDSEEEFWRQMAEEILQLDGAGGTNVQTDDGWSDSLLSILDDHLSFQPPVNQYFDMPSVSSWCFSPDEMCCEEQVAAVNNKQPTTPDSLLSPLQLPDTPASASSPHTVSSDLEDIIQPRCFTKNIAAFNDLKNRIISDMSGSNNLTLEQYINGKVVNVDFKIINAEESVVIEYKPMVRGGPSIKSKFLVKPLCKFVEEWYSADKNAAKEQTEAVYPKYINGFTKQKKFSSKKLVRPKKNCDKECQTHPQGSPVNGKSYSINESVISKKKIMLKLVTSADSPSKSNVDPKVPHLDNISLAVKAAEGANPADTVNSSTDRGDDTPSASFNQAITINCDTSLITDNSTSNCLPLLSPKKEPDVVNDQLLTVVNQKFEEYYQRLMRNTKPDLKPFEPPVKSEHELICISDSSSSEDDNGYSTASTRMKLVRRRKPLRQPRRKQPMNPVDFVSQILSSYSSLPQNGSLPPMSITVNIGDPTAPVQVNVQPRCRTNFDGIDDSSSDESVVENPRKRKSKYRPLKVSVQPSPVSARKSRKTGEAPQKTKVPPSSTSDASPCCSTQKIVHPVTLSNSPQPSCSTQPMIGCRSPIRRRLTRSSVSRPVVQLDQPSGHVPQTDVITSSGDDDGTQAMAPHKKRKIKKFTQSKEFPKPKEIEAVGVIQETIPKLDNVTTFDSGLAETSMTDLFQVLPTSQKSSTSITTESGNFDQYAEVSSLEEINIQVANTSPKSITIKPKFCPPSKEEILSSLNECEFLETTGVEPFYSNINDATKSIEVGNKALKVGHQYSDLKLFESSVGLSLEQIRANILDGEALPRIALVPDCNVVITPLLKPPSKKEVMNWSTAVEKVVKDAPPALKLLMPGGSDESNSGNESMTLTPCTPSVMSDCSSVSAVEHSPALLPRLSSNTSLPPVTPTSRPPRRVSFDDAVRSRSCSPSAESTPHARRRSSTATLPTISEELSILKKGPLSRVKNRRLLAKNNRRCSTESNHSADMFIAGPDRPMEDEVKAQSPLGNYTLSSSSSKKNRSCQIQGVSLNNTFGFKTSLQNFQEAKPSHNFQHITLLAMEVLTSVRGEMRPDPQLDPILAVFFGLIRDYPPETGPTSQYGIFLVGDVLKGTALDKSIVVHVLPDEISLLDQFLKMIHQWDPDMLAGWEIEQGSWGYVIQRASVLSVNMLARLGRTILPQRESAAEDSKDDFDVVPKFIRQLRVPGRIVLNVWRLLRHEIALTSYTWENVMFHLLHERHHRLSFNDLSHLWMRPTPRSRIITANYLLTRVRGVCRILEQLDLLARTSELARLFGIQFEEVLTRGSQFRVESMMLRLSKPANLVPVSPSMEQRAHMRAPASLPLIMEPESRFYADPVIVLDFQSLYPSIIIAYNYCFSTCLGRASLLGRSDEPFEFGCTRLSVPLADLKDLHEKIHISPAGVAFARAYLRRGILPTMLEEILDTRLMVKKSMKDNKQDKVLQKVLHARQLGLKLIANVTYGYTAANFSGRMPCIEIGDSVVSKGRETLQRAIRLVQSTPRWGARVVYGDTDSLFVLTPGRTREEAFRIGDEIANAVTLDNPRPVKLKLEKVYQPCILQTKKRYVGYMYETPKQSEPIYEAKGIETVRRDGCPATAKILQKALQILFDTGDVSLVKKYTLQQFGKLFQGRVNLQDLIFAKEYRGRSGYRPSACVPALQLAKQWTSVDRRAEPRKKERVPYVIVHGAPGVPLIRLVRSPQDLLTDSSLRVHAAYYITKAIIPPLQRCFTLLGADPLSWYSEMPRRYHRMVRSGLMESRKRHTISQYFASLDCVACGRLSQERVCPGCLADPAALVTQLSTKARTYDRAVERVNHTCASCCGRFDYINCISLDCPTVYRKRQLECDAQQGPVIRQILANIS